MGSGGNKSPGEAPAEGQRWLPVACPDGPHGQARPPWSAPCPVSTSRAALRGQRSYLLCPKVLDQDKNRQHRLGRPGPHVGPGCAGGASPCPLPRPDARQTCPPGPHPTPRAASQQLPEQTRLGNKVHVSRCSSPSPLPRRNPGTEKDDGPGNPLWETEVIAAADETRNYPAKPNPHGRP